MNRVSGTDFKQIGEIAKDDTVPNGMGHVEKLRVSQSNGD